MRIIREKTAAVCVDYQERILPAMTDPETLLQNTVKLLEGLRVLGVPVYLTQQYTKGLGDTVAPIREAAGTSEHLEKLTFSAYPQLREKLAASLGLEHMGEMEAAEDFAHNTMVPTGRSTPLWWPTTTTTAPGC